MVVRPDVMLLCGRLLLVFGILENGRHGIVHVCVHVRIHGVRSPYVVVFVTCANLRKCLKYI